MRVTTTGRICNAVHKEHSSGTKKDGTGWDSPETYTVLLCADFNAALVRCRVTAAQFADLEDPSQFGALLEVRGDTERVGFTDYLNVVSYSLAAKAAA